MSRTKAAKATVKAKVSVPDAKLMDDDILRLHLALRHATLKLGTGNRTDRQSHSMDHFHRRERMDHTHGRGTTWVEDAPMPEDGGGGE
jgi:hypothetical protein